MFETTFFDFELGSERDDDELHHLMSGMDKKGWELVSVVLLPQVQENGYLMQPTVLRHYYRRPRNSGRQVLTEGS